ncbi:MAG: metal-sensitive transcriptional regulator [Gemmatimonadota bacterium]
MVEVTASKRQLIHRVAGVEGHVGSLKKMIEEDRGTLEILMQLSAIRAALARLSSILFEEFVEEKLATIGGEGEGGGGGRQEAIAEIRGAMQTFL